MSKNQPFTLGAVFKGGLLLLIPLVLLYTIGEQLVDLLLMVAAPFDAELPAGYVPAAGVVIGAIILLILVLGIIGRMSFVQRTADWVEDKVLSLIPGYALVRQFARSKLDESEAAHWPAVVIKDGEDHSIGVLVDDADAEYATVYIPFAPQGFSGITKVVHRSRITYLEGKDAGDVIDLCLAFGQGTAGITRQALNR